MSLFTVDLARSCTLCDHVGGEACFHCGYDHKYFSLNKRELEEEVEIGLISKKTAKKIIEQNEKDKGIPGQLRLTEGDTII